MVKVYAIHGRTAVEISLKVGQAVLPLNFEKGCLDSRYYRPATFSTGDPVIQDMIENSDMFNSSVIVLFKTYNSGPATDEKKKIVRKDSKAIPRPKDPEPAIAPVPDEPQPKEETSQSSPSEEVESSDKDNMIIREEVTTKEQAVSVLKSLGAKATEIKDDEAIEKYMRQNKISFPNYKN